MDYSYLQYLFFGYLALVSFMILVISMVFYIVKQAQFRAMYMPEHVRKTELWAIFLPLGR